MKSRYEKSITKARFWVGKARAKVMKMASRVA
jgi:hypothetical protein